MIYSKTSIEVAVPKLSAKVRPWYASSGAVRLGNLVPSGSFAIQSNLPEDRHKSGMASDSRRQSGYNGALSRAHTTARVGWHIAEKCVRNGQKNKLNEEAGVPESTMQPPIALPCPGQNGNGFGGEGHTR